MATEIDPVLALLALGDAVTRGEPVPAQVGAWLRDGIKEYLDGQGPLDGCLRLRRAGWSASLAHRRMVRDRHLRAACLILKGDHQLLAEHIVRFQTRVWPRCRSMSSPPASASELQRCLFAAFQAGITVPSSSRHLSRICA